MATTVESIFQEVEQVAKKGGSGKRASWKGVLSIVDPSLIGETSNLALNFSLKAAKIDTDQAAVSIKKVDIRDKKELITKEVVINSEGKIDLRSHVERRSFQMDKFDLDSVKKGKNSFLPELVQKGTIEDVPADCVATLQDGEEVGMFERVKNLEIEGAVQLSRLSEYKFHELYMLKPDADANETSARIATLARTLLEREKALVCFFSWGRGYRYFSAVIFPFERKADGKLWLVMGLAEGRMVFDEAWSLEGAANATAQEVPVIKKARPKVTISK